MPTCIGGGVHCAKQAEGGVARHALGVAALRNDQAAAACLLQQASDALQRLRWREHTGLRRDA